MFINWPDTLFNIEKGLGWYSGIHVGSDINYMMQGMSWSAGGHSKAMMHSAIRAWNIGQVIRFEGLRNLRQIPHAQNWAEYGYDYYEEMKRGSQ
jgi:hypothetical protein